MQNLANYLGNPRIPQLKKVIYEILKNKYPPHDVIIERIGYALQTEKDIKDFLKFVSDVYEVSYLKAIDDHKEQLKKLGMVAKVVPDQKSKEG